MFDSSNVVPFHRQPPSSIADEYRRIEGVTLNALAQISNSPLFSAEDRARAAATLTELERARRGSGPGSDEPVDDLRQHKRGPPALSLRRVHHSERELRFALLGAWKLQRAITPPGFSDA